ncbi:hypothetical protein ACFYNO_39720 [Kitasatospora sp. NPDC006697]|uniref:hypothetical protein n=1 Tax=Kitasatospora sp. NPDC006697 TaxID=3364020 RepID=UPI00368C6E26
MIQWWAYVGFWLFWGFLVLCFIVVPNVVFGLTVALSSDRWALPWRIMLVLATAGVAAVVWRVLMPAFWLLCPDVLAGVTVLVSGGLLLVFKPRRRPAIR